MVSAGFAAKERDLDGLHELVHLLYFLLALKLHELHLLSVPALVVDQRVDVLVVIEHYLFPAGSFDAQNYVAHFDFGVLVLALQFYELLDRFERDRRMD